MAARPTMIELITLVRRLIGDPWGSPCQQFEDQDIQAALDDRRVDVRYELLAAAPTIVNLSGMDNDAQIIYSDYYSDFTYWEQDAVLQGSNPETSVSWIVLNPAASDYASGHFQFELDVYNSGVVPGQWPPVFIVGHTYDPFGAAGDLLTMWAAMSSRAYDISGDGQSLRRSQIADGLRKQADAYYRRAKPRTTKMVRPDVVAQLNTNDIRLLDDEVVR
jgi:hypothetical protein